MKWHDHKNKPHALELRLRYVHVSYFIPCVVYHAAKVKTAAQLRFYTII